LQVPVCCSLGHLPVLLYLYMQYFSVCP
jgi:hypothetical protein